MITMNLEKTLPSLVLNLAVQKADGSLIQSGSGTIVHHENEWYLLTAKHCFVSRSTQHGKTVPALADSAVTVFLFDSNIQLLHQEPLVDNLTAQLKFKVVYVSESEALDVALLKLSNPHSDIKQLSISSSLIAMENAIDYADQLYCCGFLSDKESKVGEAFSRYTPEFIQSLLGEEADNYFLMEAGIDMTGMSGAVVYSIGHQRVVGILAGQNRNYPIAYIHHSRFFWACLNQYKSEQPHL